MYVDSLKALITYNECNNADDVFLWVKTSRFFFILKITVMQMSLIIMFNIIFKKYIYIYFIYIYIYIKWYDSFSFLKWFF